MKTEKTTVPVFKGDGERILFNAFEKTFALDNQEDFIVLDKKIIFKHHVFVEIARAAEITDEGFRFMHFNEATAQYIMQRTLSSKDDVKAYTIGINRDVQIACDMAYDLAVIEILGWTDKVFESSRSDNTQNPTAQVQPPKKKPDATAKTVQKQSGAVNTDVSEEPVQKKTTEEQSPPPTEKADEKPEDHLTEIKKENPDWIKKLGVGEYSDSQLNPDSFIVTEGKYAESGITILELYNKDAEQCIYYARRDLQNASDDFKKQVYSCRRLVKRLIAA